MQTNQLTADQIRANLERLNERVALSAERASRRADQIQVIAVTKYVDAGITKRFFEAGCRDLGESRPQSIWEKHDAVAEPLVKWHLIGHLQRNKVKRTLPLVSLIHSLDSPRLYEQLRLDCRGVGCGVRVLLEVNVSEDSEKTGLSVAQAEGLLDQVARNQTQPNEPVSVVGLMGMSSLTGGPDQANRDFERLRELRDSWAAKFELPLPELSMGMSDDFEIAIQHGSTMIRVGSLLLEP